MALNTFKSNCLTPLHFKGLNVKLQTFLERSNTPQPT